LGYIIGNDGDVSIIYRNNGNNSFTEQTNISLISVRYGSAAWGDYDNDGYLDILLTGVHNPGEQQQIVSKIYHNNGNNTFTEQTLITLPGVMDSRVSWCDYDNDGFLDILLTGLDESSGVISRLYHNNGDNTFTYKTSISLINITMGSVAWGDYDNDGYPDILLTGESNIGRISKIYHNNGNNTFTEQASISLVGIGAGSVVWGDYDNDGYLDILLTGASVSGVSISKIYHNNGNNVMLKLKYDFY